MNMLAQVIFILLTTTAIWLFSKKIKEIRRNILLGRDEDFSGDTKQRWRNLLLLALGQKKMFRNPLVAVMHFVIYAGFIIINAEVLEIVLDGIFGTHRLFMGLLGSVYSWLINAFEVLAVGVLTVCIIFLIRRNILKLKRFISKDLNGWPRSDANYILLTEIILMGLFLTMNAADSVSHYIFPDNLMYTGKKHMPFFPDPNIDFVVSSFIQPLLYGLNHDQLLVLERTCWWLHITGIFVFLNYLPWSKHLHIILAFPNAYYARLTSKGKMTNMPEIQQEVLYAMQPELAPTGEAAAGEHKHFGAKDVFDLSWRNLLDAYSCTECGRCTAACPANITGKALSPRLIMMKTRDRLEEVGKNINLNKAFKDDGKSLLHSYITEEELRACTTCNACVEECPVGISPLDIILQGRRYLIMEESNAPQEWNGMFSNTENNQAPWKFAPDERDKWAEVL